MNVSKQVRRKLITDFFGLGKLSRWEVCESGGWLTEGDIGKADGQALWAMAFDRAEKRGELNKLRELVDAQGESHEKELRACAFLGPGPSRD